MLFILPFPLFLHCNWKFIHFIGILMTVLILLVKSTMSSFGFVFTYYAVIMPRKKIFLVYYLWNFYFDGQHLNSSHTINFKEVFYSYLKGSLEYHWTRVCRVWFLPFVVLVFISTWWIFAVCSPSEIHTSYVVVFHLACCSAYEGVVGKQQERKISWECVFLGV